VDLLRLYPTVKHGRGRLGDGIEQIEVKLGKSLYKKR
jgi:hypothetical protein